jgi:predicted DCC family thiol-disulfide oxidoreductase YuxK
MQTPVKHIVLFDGMCHVCSFSVRSLLLIDRKKTIHFAPLQSTLGKQLSTYYKANEQVDSFLFISNGQCFSKSAAIIQLFKTLGGIWRLMGIFAYLPLRVRDKLYDWVAKNRYTLFGKRTSCSLPPPNYRDRFL